MSFNLPNSYLLGILLVVSTHSGPQLVYNYPPVLSHDLVDQSHTAKLMVNSEDDGSMDDHDVDDDEYIVDSEENDDVSLIELKDDLKWNTRNLNYYMGTKKELMEFLDDQEKHRERTPKQKKSLRNKDTIPLEKTLSARSEKSLFSNNATLPTIANVVSNTSFQLGAPAIPTQQHSLTLSPSNNQNSSTSLNLNSQLGSPSSIPSSSNNKGNSTSPDVASTIFGIEQAYLCETLCPPRQMCNSRFEMLIDDLVFLGLPIHCHDNGSWRSKKKRVRRKASKVSKDGLSLGEKSNEGESEKARNDDSTNFDDEKDDDDGNPKPGNSNEKKSNTMSMFHLVFIMNPPIIECNYRIDEMFYYVISRLSLVLRYEQLKHDYVWQQIKLIQKFKEEYRTVLGGISGGLASYLNHRASLCKMISDCYYSISRSEIANLSINNKLRSFQIPIKTEFHSLPESTVPYLPGSHLSSTVSLLGKTGLINVGDTTRYGISNMMSILTRMGDGTYGGSIGGGGASGNSGSTGVGPADEGDYLEDDDSDSSEDIIHFALLLLDDPETIVSDIKAEPQSTLANFIRMIKPTESLSNLASKLEQSQKVTEQLSITEIKSFAFHLIYWRRARVIPPLNSRSVYIVSPMAPVTLNLYFDIQKFLKEFSTLPSLPHFLKLLSSSSRKPRQYATIIPSRDHREVYLDALGWLIRYGYVTQLHTFIWLKISRKVKMKVEEDLENESSSKKKGLSSASKGVRSSKSVDSKTGEDENDVNTSIQATSNVVGTDNTSKKVSKTKSTQNKSSSYVPSMDHDGFPQLSGPNITLEDDSDTIILDPDRATTLERRWINKIVSEESRLSPELTAVFYKLLKYMDGKNSLELLLLKEDVSRNDLRKLLFAIEDHVISVRHW